MEWLFLCNCHVSYCAATFTNLSTILQLYNNHWDENKNESNWGNLQKSMLTYTVMCVMMHIIKSLVLTGKAYETRMIGEMVNLMSVDAQRFVETLSYFHLIWSGPLQIIVALVLLYWTMGLATIAGLAVLLLLLPLTVLVFVVGRFFQTKLMKAKDKRLKMIYGIISGIKVPFIFQYMIIICIQFQVIKLYAWERPFRKRIKQMRNTELKNLKSIALVQSFATLTWFSSNTIVSLPTSLTN